MKRHSVSHTCIAQPSHSYADIESSSTGWLNSIFHIDIRQPFLDLAIVIYVLQHRINVNSGKGRGKMGIKKVHNFLTTTRR